GRLRHAVVPRVEAAASRPCQRRKELRLHAERDFAYAIVFGSLAWVAWQGWLVWLLALVVLFEILVTRWEFLAEDVSRPVATGERVMHPVMEIVYGAFLANLLPQLAAWATGPPRFVPVGHGLPSWLMTAMAVGVFGSGVRDVIASCAARGLDSPSPKA